MEKMEDINRKPTMSRRGFLQLAGTAGLAAGAALLLPNVTNLIPTVNAQEYGIDLVINLNIPAIPEFEELPTFDKGQIVMQSLMNDLFLNVHSGEDIKVVVGNSLDTIYNLYNNIEILAETLNIDLSDDRELTLLRNSLGFNSEMHLGTSTIAVQANPNQFLTFGLHQPQDGESITDQLLNLDEINSFNLQISHASNGSDESTTVYLESHYEGEISFDALEINNDIIDRGIRNTLISVFRGSNGDINTTLGLIPVASGLDPIVLTSDQGEVMLNGVPLDGDVRLFHVKESVN